MCFCGCGGAAPVHRGRGDKSDRKNTGAVDEPGGTPCWFPLQAAKGEGLS